MNGGSFLSKRRHMQHNATVAAAVSQLRKMQSVTPTLTGGPLWPSPRPAPPSSPRPAPPLVSPLVRHTSDLHNIFVRRRQVAVAVMRMVPAG